MVLQSICSCLHSPVFPSKIFCLFSFFFITIIVVLYVHVYMYILRVGVGNVSYGFIFVPCLIMTGNYLIPF